MKSIFIGISIAAIPGSIFFELVRRTLTRGFWAGAFVAIGEFFGNFTVLLLIFFGLSEFLSYDISKMILYILGAFILIYLGIMAFKIKEDGIEKSYEKEIKNTNPIMTGFAIAVTSPVVIGLWISLSGSYLTQFESKYLAFFHIFLIAFGFLLFFFPLAFVVHQIRHKIPPNYVSLLSKISGFILLMYGISFIYKACLILN